MDGQTLIYQCLQRVPFVLEAHPLLRHEDVRQPLVEEVEQRGCGCRCSDVEHHDGAREGLDLDLERHVDAVGQLLDLEQERRSLACDRLRY